MFNNFVGFLRKSKVYSKLVYPVSPMFSFRKICFDGKPWKEMLKEYLEPEAFCLVWSEYS